MDSSSSDEVAYDWPPLFRIYKDDRVERLKGTETVPPSTNPRTGVQSKDVVISPESDDISARLFIPKITNPTQKLPLLIYIHGGAFCIESPFSPPYHNYLTSIVAQANVVAVSVHYRRAPEHPLPIAYDDTWAAILWVASHSNGEVGTGTGTEPWLKDHTDFSRVFLAGDSAGANIAHDMAVRAGATNLGGVKFVGIVLAHPFFGNNEPNKFYAFIFPTSTGCEDPRLNPGADPSRLKSMGCTRVLVCVAGKDRLRDRGWAYYNALKTSGCCGVVKIMETEGEGHVFHLFNPSCEKAVTMMREVVAFMNQD